MGCVSGTSVRASLKRNNIELIYIPPNCTDQLQPLDQLVNKEFKDILKKEFHQWYTDCIIENMSDENGDRDEIVSSIDLRLSYLKSIHAAWLVRTIDELSTKNSLLKKSFEVTGILGVL